MRVAPGRLPLELQFQSALSSTKDLRTLVFILNKCQLVFLTSFSSFEEEALKNSNPMGLKYSILKTDPLRQILSWHYNFLY